MLRRFGRLFIIKKRWEACLVIYALALGAVERGLAFVEHFPGAFGWLLFLACTVAVFMAGAVILDSTRKDNGLRRRKADRTPAAYQ
jgi:hypothetical protein